MAGDITGPLSIENAVYFCSVEALGGNLTATMSGEGRRIVLSLLIALGAPSEPRLVSA
jgi:hypothetical protein